MTEQDAALLSGENDSDAIERKASNVEEYEALAVSQKIEMYDKVDDRQHDKYNPNEFSKFFTKPKGLCSCPITIWDKVIIAVYISVIIVTIIMTVLYFMAEEDIQEMLSLFIVCVSTWVGCVVAIIAIKHGFSVKGQTEELKQVNQGYWDELQDLKATRHKLMEELKETRKNARQLTAAEEQMRAHVQEFGEVVTEFQKLRDIFPEKFDKTFAEIEETDSLLKLIEGQNHRAKLYAAFYDAHKDDQSGLSRSEFRKFLLKIPNDYREKFEQLGLTFEAINKLLDEDDEQHDNDDETISKYEFEKAVYKVIEAVQADQEMQAQS